MTEHDATPPRPTDAELGILQVLWRLGPATVREVHAELELERQASTGYTTTLKLLQIMADKGLVVRDESNRAHVYAAREVAATTQRRLVGDLIERAFAGATDRLVLQALAARPTTRAELDAIRDFLDTIDPQPNKDGGPV